MNNLFKLNTQSSPDVKEKVGAGILGAFLFSLAGALCYCVLYYVGFIAGISGILGFFCATKGYGLFAKKESIKGVIIAVIMALISITIGWYLCFAFDIYSQYQEWYANGEIDFALTLVDSLRAVPLFLTEPEVGPAYLGDLGIGILFSILGGGGYVYRSICIVKNKKAAEAAAAASATDPAFDYSDVDQPGDRTVQEAEKKDGE
jgi:hypothetical protein